MADPRTPPPHAGASRAEPGLADPVRAAVQPGTPSRGWRLVRAAFVLAVLLFAAQLLASHWAEVRALGATLEPDWLRVAGSGAIVLLSYAVLIATWRATVVAWGERIAVGTAARIWFVSNLGKYLPGKVWQVGAMGAMAQRAGVSAVAAVGSALVVSLVHVLVGFAVVAATGRDLLAAATPAGALLPAALVVLALGLLLAPWILPPALRLLGRLTGRHFTTKGSSLPPRAIWLAALGGAVAWLLYGLAFRELALALLPGATGAAAGYIAVFTLSYLLGFLALFAPGGIGVRELSMGALLVSAGLADPAGAAVLVVASRLWLTVLEILPGLLFLAWPAAPSAIPPAAPPSASPDSP